MSKALLIPVEGPVRELEVDGLDSLQQAVGGNIEAVPLPDFIRGADDATAYVNEEGKFECVDEEGKVLVNFRATDFMVPGVGLRFGDFIAGPMLLVGFDPDSGYHTDSLPADVIARARLIEREAA